jgi:hypothetical protein
MALESILLSGDTVYESVTATLSIPGLNAERALPQDGSARGMVHTNHTYQEAHVTEAKPTWITSRIKVPEGARDCYYWTGKHTVCSRKSGQCHFNHDPAKKNSNSEFTVPVCFRCNKQHQRSTCPLASNRPPRRKVVPGGGQTDTSSSSSSSSTTISPNQANATLSSRPEGVSEYQEYQKFQAWRSARASSETSLNVQATPLPTHVQVPVPPAGPEFKPLPRRSAGLFDFGTGLHSTFPHPHMRTLDTHMRTLDTHTHTRILPHDTRMYISICLYTLVVNICIYLLYICIYFTFPVGCALYFMCTYMVSLLPWVLWVFVCFWLSNRTLTLKITRLTIAGVANTYCNTPPEEVVRNTMYTTHTFLLMSLITNWVMGLGVHTIVDFLIQLYVLVERTRRASMIFFLIPILIPVHIVLCVYLSIHVRVVRFVTLGLTLCSGAYRYPYLLVVVLVSMWYSLAGLGGSLEECGTLTSLIFMYIPLFVSLCTCIYLFLYVFNPAKVLYSVVSTTLRQLTPITPVHFEQVNATFDGTNRTIRNKAWVLDDACTVHITTDINSFVPGSVVPCDTFIKGFNNADGTPAQATCKGTVILHSWVPQAILKPGHTQVSTVTLTNVVLVPTAAHNLISEGLLMREGSRIMGIDKHMHVTDSRGKVVY